MLFSSWFFVSFFLPITWVVFTLLKKHAGHEITLLWLVAASLFFYGWFKPIYLVIVLVSIAFNYALGLQLSNNRINKHNRKRLLIFGITANLSALVYYKYTGLFFETLNNIGGTLDIPHIVLPLGISFFTFQKIAWLVDSYRGDTKEMNFLHYALFITFFPQLIAGPIVHHKDIIPQFLRKKNKKTLQHMQVMGLSVFIIGLFKKVAIADYMGDVADPVFNTAAMGTNLSLIEAWLGVTAYTMQIYFDFSGYSDMAIGLGALFGVRLPLNFFSPYKSHNIIEFWRRWHMTLSRFLRDYLYIPLGGNRKGVTRRYLNLLTTMMLGGFWHGANWTFLVWGALHGLFLIVNHAWQRLGFAKIPKPMGVLITFLCVMMAWIFFRADSVKTAVHILECLTGKYGVELRNPEGIIGNIFSLLGIEVQQTSMRLLRIGEKWYILWLALGLAFFAPSTHELMRQKLALDNTRITAGVAKPRWVWRPTPAWAVAIALMASLACLLLTRVSAFIYFQF